MAEFNEHGIWPDDHLDHGSALTVNPGIEQPPIVDTASLQRFLSRKRKPLTLNEYMDGILDGNCTLLSQAITLVESSLPEHAQMAQDIVERCLPYSGKSMRIGITGVPGAGKSTFIEALGGHLTSKGHKLAVLAIDPSSERSKGSILGDKTRMEELSADPHAFIRPSPSSGSLGGVAQKTRETVFLCEAAGFDIIFIETVGVGQSETAVHSMTDFFLLIQIAGAGDELQGIKRGIMEMADLITVNKADGGNLEKAQLAQAQYMSALRLFPKPVSGWEPQATICSAVTRFGIDNIWEAVQQYERLTKDNGYFEQRRKQQAKYWMNETIRNSLVRHFYNNPDIKALLPEYEQKITEDKTSSFAAARALLNEYFKNKINFNI
ncbi:MAG: methylmalonyl Co-A mutase-associated GTPase MeaB [Bacteroidales bacterium]|jgi:LAO/AO transport system kinase|nr:methylmalonyl Co-A mutase-associated GTPase MeaB [Bacteroidales bacterium]